MYRTRTWPGFSRVGGRAGVSNEAVEGVQERGQGLATPRRRVDQRVLAARDRRPALGLRLGRGLEARGEPLADGRAERRERIRAGERGHGTCQYRFPPPNRPDVPIRPHRSWPRRPQSRRQARHLVSTTGPARRARVVARCRPDGRRFRVEAAATAVVLADQPRRWPCGRRRGLVARPVSTATRRFRTAVRADTSRGHGSE